MGDEGEADLIFSLDNMTLADAIESFVLGGISMAERVIFSKGIYTKGTEWPVRFYDPITDGIVFGEYNLDSDFEVVDDGVDIICEDGHVRNEIEWIRQRYGKLMSLLSNGKIQGVSDDKGQLFRVRKSYWAHPEMLVEIVSGDLVERSTGDIIFRAIELRCIRDRDGKGDSNKKRSGAKPKYDWEGAKQEFHRLQAIPEHKNLHQAGFAKLIQDWFAESYEKIPDYKNIEQNYVKKWLNGER